MLINVIVLILSQCAHISNHHIVYVKKITLYNLDTYNSFLLLLEYNCFTMLCFCGTTKWISYTYTSLPSLLGLPPPPHPPHLGHHRAPSWAPCAIQQVPTSYLFYTWWCIYVNPNLPVHPTLPFPAPRVHMSVLYACVSIPVPQIGSSVPFF